MNLNIIDTQYGVTAFPHRFGVGECNSDAERGKVPRQHFLCTPPAVTQPVGSVFRARFRPVSGIQQCRTQTSPERGWSDQKDRAACSLTDTVILTDYTLMPPIL